MKLTPANLTFHDAATAATWPEGSIVLQVLLREGKPRWEWSTTRISSYHRPDWCDKSHKNADRFNLKLHYCLLALP